MRRTILMALLGALLFASPALAQGTRVEILRDCQDDGILQGSYTASQMRDARNNIPAELDEYSDCRDVLSRGISAKTSSKSSSDNAGSGGSSTGGGSTGGGSSSSGGSSSGGSTSTDSGSSADSGGGSPTDSDELDSGHAFPSTPQDWAAVEEAKQEGQRFAGDLRQVSPGATRLTATVGRNGIPGVLVGVLALLGAAALALVVAPLIRRRGLGAN